MRYPVERHPSTVQPISGTSATRVDPDSTRFAGRGWARHEPDFKSDWNGAYEIERIERFTENRAAESWAKRSVDNCEA